MIQNQENLYLHGFNLLPQFGPKRLLNLANSFNTFADAFAASRQELIKASLEEPLADLFLAHRQELNLQAEAEKLESLGIKLLSYRDELYPKLLLEIPQFPPLLYYKGTLVENELALAVVGTRTISTYGQLITPQIVGPLAQAGMSIVSGLAYGVDALAHKTALDTGGRTIAVLGCGLDEKSIYPKDHQFLASEIVNSGGLLVSEHPPGTPALKQHFVARNRIISGLSLGTLVIECSSQSGALITAGHALEHNRSVFAVPGPITSKESEGPNNLIRAGAKLVVSAQDILEDFNLTLNQPLPLDLSELSEAERLLLENLSHEPITATELIKKLSWEAGEVSATLTFLEMKGVVKNLGSQQYVRTKHL